MAGPIRNLILMMRDNRQQRLGDGPALFPRIRERMAARAEDREDRPGVRKLLRSLGVGSSRSDYMSARNSVTKPEDRTPQEDAMGPDTTYSRPYSGDGVDGETRKVITAVSNKNPAAASTLPSPVPEPIARGSAASGDPAPMPDVPDVASLQKNMMALQSQLASASVEQVPKIKAQLATLKGLLEYQTVQGELAAKSQRQTFAYNMGEVDKAARQAVMTGQYAPLEALVIGSNALTRTDSAGNILVKPDVQRMVRPHAREHIAGTIGRLAQGQGLGQGEQAVLHSAINYAYPVQLVDPESKKPVTPQKMAAEANRLYSELLVDFPVGTPEQRAFLRSLANVTVKRQAASLGITGLQLPTNQ